MRLAYHLFPQTAGQELDDEPEGFRWIYDQLARFYDRATGVGHAGGRRQHPAAGRDPQPAR